MMLRRVVWFVFAAAFLRFTSSSNCTQTEFQNQEIDVNRSRQNGAQIDAYATFALKTFDECVGNCCDDENCTVVNYWSAKKTANCILYRCNPVEKCDFKNSTLDTQAGKVQRNDNVTVINTTTAVPIVPSTTTTASKLNSTTHPYYLLNSTNSTTSITGNLTEISQILQDEDETVTIASANVVEETSTEGFNESKKESQPRKGVEQEPVKTTTNLLTENVNFTVSPNETTSETTSNVTESSPKKISLEKLINATIYDSDSKSELIPPNGHLKESVHLIIALVIGLVLLIGVFGVLLRQLCDSWERRHYQRMDFLIDGMYNVNTT